MKKAVILTSCALLSTPIFAKTFLDSITHVTKQNLLASSADRVDFSGNWIGDCSFTNDEPFTMTMDIKQNKEKLSVKIGNPNSPDDSDLFTDPNEYVFNNVRVESSSSPKMMVSTMAIATWTKKNAVQLEFRSSMFSAQKKDSSYSMRAFSWSDYTLALEGDYLRVIAPTRDQRSCVLHRA